VKNQKTIAAALILIAISGISAAAQLNSGMISARESICNVLYNIRMLLYYITSGVMVVTITLAGVRWIGSQEDAGERKRARESIVHAVVGGIIVLMAGWIVLMIVPLAQCALP